MARDTSQEESSPLDRQVGENVVRLRGDRSQKELADEMRERGYKWSQATVWAVEKGNRPLRLAEAAVLAEILRVSVGVLLGDEVSVVVKQDVDAVERAQQQVHQAFLAFRSSQRRLARTADRFAQTGRALPVETSHLESLLRLTPDDILAIERAAERESVQLKAKYPGPPDETEPTGPTPYFDVFGDAYRNFAERDMSDVIDPET
ncbi:helix-turn-helix domain-containing protein [Agromyces sp. NPDC056965]|uniref:helix-turn-helix domain-containing protein n=1 Tax=Agromyces sp. NPDC056965 TaxID=3345983 RepID=UPI0036394AEA